MILMNVASCIGWSVAHVVVLFVWIVSALVGSNCPVMMLVPTTTSWKHMQDGYCWDFWMHYSKKCIFDNWTFQAQSIRSSFECSKLEIPVRDFPGLKWLNRSELMDLNALFEKFCLFSSKKAKPTKSSKSGQRFYWLLGLIVSSDKTKDPEI